MQSQNTKLLDIYEDFDCKYLFLQIIAHKKWILFSSTIFLLCATIYCSTAEKVWVTQVRIQGQNQNDQKSLFLFNQQILNSKYGFEPISSDSILNEFISYVDKKSEAVRIRKDLKKSYLVQFFSRSAVQSDENLLNFLNEQNDLFLQEYRNRLLDIIDQRLIDEQLQLFVQNQIQNQRQTYIMNLMNEVLFLNRDRYIIEKAADFNSTSFRDKEVKSMKQALLQIKNLLEQPILGSAFQIMERIKVSEKPDTPNIPIVLILSSVLGFCLGLFGVIFYVSSQPLIRTK